jgi:hypothetical protein
MQQFIGDRYDRFLFLVSQLQAAVRSGLVRKDDDFRHWLIREAA